jgi:hypothetical protein
MWKYAVAAVAFAALGSPVMAGERLANQQLDSVTAGRTIQLAVALAHQHNFNLNSQYAGSASAAYGGCAFGCKFSGNASSSAGASNWNGTAQSNSNGAANVD